MMIRKTFVRTIEFDAIQFDPDEHPWHRCVQCVTSDGEILPHRYELAIGDRSVPLHAKDWIIVDSTGWNAEGVIPVYELARPDFYHIKMVD